MTAIVITQCSTGHHASLETGAAHGQWFETPEQLAAAGYSIAQLSAMINEITGKTSRQPSVARASARLFRVLGADK